METYCNNYKQRQPLVSAIYAEIHFHIISTNQLTQKDWSILWSWLSGLVLPQVTRGAQSGIKTYEHLMVRESQASCGACVSLWATLMIFHLPKGRLCQQTANLINSLMRFL